MMKKTTRAAKLISISLGAVLMFGCIGCNSSDKKKADEDSAAVVDELYIEGQTEFGQKSLRAVSHMPSVQTDYKYMDYKQIAQKQDAIVYDFLNNPDYVPMDKNTYAPIGYWDDVTQNAKSGRTFGLPSYVGHIDGSGGGTYYPGGQEGITVLSSLLSSTWAGIDKSSQQGYDLIEMIADDYVGPEGLVLNRPNSVSGQTFWYEMYPQILYSQIAAEYPSETALREQMIRGADRWVDALPYFKDADGNVSFNFQSFNFSSMRPSYTDAIGRSWLEPSQGGIAYILYCAYRISDKETKKAEYLKAMEFCMDNLEQSVFNGYYEVVQDFNPLMAAIMNFYFDKQYDVEKLLNFIFDADSDVRPDWGVITDANTGKYSYNGLFGVTNENVSYAFAMNTFRLGSVLAPIAKYDPRFATDIGKWFLNASNNARIFFPNEVPSENQSMGGALPFDEDGVIPYEGARMHYNGKTPYVGGDPTVYGWGQTDFGIYGGVHVGMFGGLIDKTDVSQILRIDLNKTDSYGANAYPSYLYYNPYKEEKEITVSAKEASRLFDTVRCEYVTKTFTGDVKIKIPAESARVVTVIPASQIIIKKGNIIQAGGKTIAKLKPSVSLTTGNNVQKESVKGKVKFDVSVGSYTDIEDFAITVNGLKAYGGKPVSSFAIDTADYPNGNYRVEVSVKSSEGQTDRSAVKINICNPADPAKTVYAPTASDIINRFETDRVNLNQVGNGVKIACAESGGYAMGEAVEIDFDRDPLLYFTLSDYNYSATVAIRCPDLPVKTKFLLAGLNKKGTQCYRINEEITKYNGEKPLTGKQTVRLVISPSGDADAYVVLADLKIIYRDSSPNSFTLTDVVTGDCNKLTYKVNG
ncbi:MAG: hypothetical protein IJU84_04265 [Clostridia bacterium]|nr:hypothetical protein [Clostridia bacterium]